MPNREWDLMDWFSDISKVQRAHWMGATSRTSRKGWSDCGVVSIAAGQNRISAIVETFGLDTKHSVSAIIACYKDGQAIPIMYERLKKTFTGLNVDHEIIFVNDCSPDDQKR